MSEKVSLFQKIKNIIGSLSFDVFLWSLGMTNSEYLDSMCGSENEESISFNAFVTLPEKSGIYLAEIDCGNGYYDYKSLDYNSIFGWDNRDGHIIRWAHLPRRKTG